MDCRGTELHGTALRRICGGRCYWDYGAALRGSGQVVSCPTAWRGGGEGSGRRRRSWSRGRLERWEDWGRWAGRVGTSKTLFVDADVHGLDGAESGINEEGDGHGVEESGCFLAPLMVEESKGVGDGSALAEEEGALDLVELELGGVEGHDEETHPGGEELLGGRDVVEDVPFGLRGLGRAVAEVAVAALDAATHHNDALEFAESGGGLFDGRPPTHQRAHGG